MSLDRLLASIQRESSYVDKKYKTEHKLRQGANTIAKGIVLGAGYLGAKSISKEKSILRDGLAGASNFVLKHLHNGIKAIDKKQKFKGITEALTKAKNAPAKTKALVVFGAIIANAFINTVKGNSYIKGVLNQAKVDEKAYRANKALENEAENIAFQKEMLRNLSSGDILINTDNSCETPEL